MRKFSPPAFVKRAQRALELPQGLPPLRLGFGMDKIGDGFGFGQIQLAVFESAARELAGLGKPKSRQRAKRRHYGIGNRAAAMSVDSTTSSPVKLLGAGNHRTMPGR